MPGSRSDTGRSNIFVARQGGGYRLDNVIPESFPENRSRNDRPVRPENLGDAPD